MAISAAVLSKGGKVLLSRQFIPISKSRIEGYLASFPKLVSVDNQHTIIDTESIRYLYQPLESLYLLLITNRQSNIMEDIDTLRTLAKLLPDYCLQLSEEAVMAHLFELVFAFDEVIGVNGYRESVTIAQVKSYTEMDSHEEKLQRIIQESKMQEAKQEAKRKAEGIAKQREDMKKLQAMGGGGGGGEAKHGRYASMEGGMGSTGGGYEPDDRDRQREIEREREEKERERARAKASSPAAVGPGGVKAKGMQLSKAKKTDDFFTQLNKEEKLAVPVRSSAAASAAGGAAAASSAAAVKTDNVRVVVREKLLVELEKDGSVKRVEVKGEVKLQILDPDFARISIQTAGAGLDKAGYKSSLHPKINKQLWSQSAALSLSDASKGFPVGNDAIQIVKWRKQGDEADIPLSINFWPTQEGAGLAVNVEYSNNSKKRLSDVVVRIPLGNGGEPAVSAVTGEWKYEQRGKMLVWRVGEVTDENATGQLEFTTGGGDTDAFYPIAVEFSSDETLSGVRISSVTRLDDGSEIEFTADHKLEVEKYTIE